MKSFVHAATQPFRAHRAAISSHIVFQDFDISGIFPVRYFFNGLNCLIFNNKQNTHVNYVIWDKTQVGLRMCSMRFNFIELCTSE